MRWPVLAVVAVLLVPAPAAAQQAWAKAYEDGVEAFEKNNDAIAEQKLLEAREKGPKQARRHNFSSVVYRPFIPDFYLGVIYARTGRLRQAQEHLERALRDELVKQDDRGNYALATSSLQRLRDEQARLAVNSTRSTQPPPPVQPTPKAITPPPGNTTTQPLPSNTTTPAVVRPLPLPAADPVWLADFRRSMDAARLSLRQSRYAAARSSVAAAATVAGDAARRQEAEALRRDIDSTQNADAERVIDQTRAAIRLRDVGAALTHVAALEGLAPGHVALPGLRSSVEGLRGALRGIADVARVERLGVKLFLSGNYQQSGDELERAVGAGVTSSRIYLFLASSRAAQALLAPEGERPALVEAARRHYAQARPGAASPARDERFISPSILQLLGGG